MHKSMSCGPQGELIVTEVDKDVYILRANDRQIKFFEALWEIPEGITYNSYIVISPEKTILLDTTKSSFAECYLEALREVTDPQDIDLIVVHHSEPDHTGALPLVLQEAGNAIVYSHPIARTIIEKTYFVKLSNYKVLREGLSIRLDDSSSLSFIATPWLHWPDTFMSILEPQGILFSGDVFGAYSIPGTVIDYGIKFGEYSWFMKKYFATVIGGYRDWVAKAINKLSSYRDKVKTLAPLHGLVIKQHVKEALSLYKLLGERGTKPCKATIVYVSMYGSVEEAIGRIKEELESRGYEVRTYGFNDRERPLLSDILGDAIDSSILVIGAATYEASIAPLAEHVVNTICSKASSGQKAIVVSSYGWGGIAGRKLSSILGSCGISVEAVIEAQGRLTDTLVSKAIDSIAGKGECQ
ncbi:MAG: FprA family A-type flavoprotein [Pyrodictiaceae archaeon]